MTDFSVDLPVPARALAVGAHPDDVEFGCGGTPAKGAAAGCSVHHLVNMVVAIGALVLVGARTVVGHFGREGYDQVKAAAAVWQYANVAWAVIVTFLYLFSAHS